MKIELPEYRGTRYCDVAMGMCFSYLDSLYLKIGNHDLINLASGESGKLAGTVLVTVHPNAKVFLCEDE